MAMSYYDFMKENYDSDVMGMVNDAVRQQRPEEEMPYYEVYKKFLETGDKSQLGGIGVNSTMDLPQALRDQGYIRLSPGDPLEQAAIQRTGGSVINDPQFGLLTKGFQNELQDPELKKRTTYPGLFKDFLSSPIAPLILGLTGFAGLQGFLPGGAGAAGGVGEFGATGLTEGAAGLAGESGFLPGSFELGTTAGGGSAASGLGGSVLNGIGGSVGVPAGEAINFGNTSFWDLANAPTGNPFDASMNPSTLGSNATPGSFQDWTQQYGMDRFTKPDGTFDWEAFDKADPFGMGSTEGAPVIPGSGPTAAGSQSWIDKLKSALGGVPGSGGGLSGLSSDPLNIARGLFGLFQSGQQQDRSKALYDQLLAGFNRSDPFAPGRAAALQKYLQYTADPSSFMSSPLAQMQIDELNRQVRAKQAQAGQTWSINPETNNIQGSGTGGVDYGKTLMTNMANQYQTNQNNLATQAGMQLFPNASFLTSAGNAVNMQNQADRAQGGALETLAGGVAGLFPKLITDFSAGSV